MTLKADGVCGNGKTKEMFILSKIRVKLKKVWIVDGRDAFCLSILKGDGVRKGSRTRKEEGWYYP